MAGIEDDRVQPALHALLASDVGGLRSAIEADPEIVSIRWGDNTLLEWATQPPHGVDEAVIDVLIAAGSAVDRALNLAGCWNLVVMCRRLLDAGADPAARADAGITPLESAAMHGSVESADVLVDHGLHRRSLWLAAASGLVEEVAEWVTETGALSRPAGPYRPDLSDVGHPPGPKVSDDPGEVLAEAMVFAGANGRMAVVDVLVERGVSLDSTVHLDVTALHLAVLFRRPDAVADLLDRGARTDLPDDRHHSDAAGWARACVRDDDESRQIAALLGVPTGP